ncbi:hypothetical protein L917_12516 [Phytophthora nicotianae]|uniref:Chitin-binding type-4 domain-containing protein n=3 Tax=Phytophthora nicotianae TaxID=4792 RepID=V9EUH3_PHYNI|nr:hypothetical protein F443_13065 [Phytophthora nicotianae P1569]ETL35159.1 hypothetical protein L916_12678 [Phytophthora nicotianae]ETL88402.1 hypothetical protein L917_12516 [Phytophthora nicotianae]ETM41648.1 hypothetical protein L914_12595 [Phytophthora nicotianae]KUF90207.1 hypothetical protein AM588_10005460 [Phytophthora nicotianae]
MKIPSCSSFLTTIGALLLLAAPTTVTAHGQMTKPTPRPISQKYRADSGALSSAGDQELQYAPVELLSSRAQSDRPAAATFNIMNGCRGTVYEASNTVTELEAGTPFDVEWVIQAPHPGTMVLSIVKPSTDISGTITYESVAELLTIDPFAVNSNDKTSTTTRIPTSVTGCGSPGDCALQFYWHSDLASQTYPTCADIVVTGSGGANGLTTTAPSTATPPPMATTASPTTITSTSSPSTAAPTATPLVSNTASEEASAPSTTPEKCIRRQRRLRKLLG